MIVYTSLDDRTILEIKTAYGIIIEHYEPAGIGSGNSNFLLNTDMGQLLLSIMEEQSLEELQNITRLLSELKQMGFHTSELISTIDGQSTFICQQKPAFIKSYVQGEVRFDLSEPMLEQLGVAIGQLHQLVAPPYLPKNNYFDSPVFAEVIGSNLDTEFEIWLRERTSDLLSNFRYDIPKGLIHGDIFCDNVLYNDNQLSAIIDFEVACYYYLVYDIGMALIGTCSRNCKLERQKVKALLKGYESIRKLTPNEWLSLQTFTEYAAIQIANWRFWKYWYRHPNVAKKDKHREMMALAQFIQTLDVIFFE